MFLRKNALRTLCSRTALALMMAGSAGMAAATTLHVQVNTADFGATSGYLDMQLSATSGVPLTSVLVTNLSGFDPAAYIDKWGVTATGKGYLFRNDASNDLFHAVDFGGTLSFDLTFDGAPDPLTRYVSRFVVSAFDEDYGLLGKHDPASGALATFSWTPALTPGANGAVDVTLADTASVTVGAPPVAAVPEPGTCLLIGAGCLAGLLTARRRSPASTRTVVPGASNA